MFPKVLLLARVVWVGMESHLQGLLWLCPGGVAITLLFPCTQWNWAWLAILLGSMGCPLGVPGCPEHTECQINWLLFE